MNNELEGYGNTQSWPNLKYYPGIFAWSRPNSCQDKQSGPI
jgi:hypothetical protein